MAATEARPGTMNLAATDRKAWLCVGTGREPASSWPTHILNEIKGCPRYEGQQDLDALGCFDNIACQMHVWHVSDS